MSRQVGIMKFLKSTSEFTEEERAAKVAAWEKRKAEADAAADATKLKEANKRGPGRPPGSGRGSSGQAVTTRAAAPNFSRPAKSTGPLSIMSRPDTTTFWWRGCISR